MSKSKSVKEALSLEYNVNMYKRKPLFAFIKRLYLIKLNSFNYSFTFVFNFNHFS